MRMGLTFSHDVPLQTMVFDERYEEVLQLTLEATLDFLRHTIAILLRCDGRLAGCVEGYTINSGTYQRHVLRPLSFALYRARSAAL